MEIAVIKNNKLDCFLFNCFLGFKMPFAVNYLQLKIFYALKLDLYEHLSRYPQFRLCHFQWNFTSGGISFMKLFVGTVI